MDLATFVATGRDVAVADAPQEVAECFPDAIRARLYAGGGWIAVLPGDAWALQIEARDWAEPAATRADMEMALWIATGTAFS